MLLRDLIIRLNNFSTNSDIFELKRIQKKINKSKSLKNMSVIALSSKELLSILPKAFIDKIEVIAELQTDTNDSEKMEMFKNIIDNAIQEVINTNTDNTKVNYIKISDLQHLLLLLIDTKIKEEKDQVVNEYHDNLDQLLPIYGHLDSFKLNECYNNLTDALETSLLNKSIEVPIDIALKSMNEIRDFIQRLS